MENEASQPPIKIVIDASITTTTTTTTTTTKHSSLLSILTTLHAGYFRISLSLGGQALLWKSLIEHTDDIRALHPVSHILPSTAFLLLWWLALSTLVTLSVLYLLRCFFHFPMVKSEFSHHVGVNYLFAPSISWLLLLQSSPFIVPNTVSYQILWWVFIVPVMALDLKIYGQWFTTEKRFLSVFANPTSQISVIGNLVGAWAAAEMGWRESAMCIFTLGAAHYLVVFITLYQQLSGGRRIPVRLRPVFFLFVAAPSIGSLAWNSIRGTFDTPCKMLFFHSLFLFTSLACRPALFKKSMRRFNVAWWAYSFPLTFLALASVEYAKQVKGIVAPGLMLMLSVLSVLVFLSLMVFTALNTNVFLHENDPSLCFGSTLRTKA
ncbi:hypothetical protein ACSBR2_016146 [Camellia fascicularis]